MQTVNIIQAMKVIINFMLVNVYRAGCTWLMLSMIIYSFAMESESDRIDALKAAYVYYFSKFTTWTDTKKNTKNHLDICIYSDKPSEINQFNTLKKRSQKDHHINIITFTTETIDVSLLDSCHILYMSKSIILDDDIYNTLANKSNILTIIEQGFPFTESIITLTTENNKLGFIINQTKAEKNNIKISAKLLRLAKKVM